MPGVMKKLSVILLSALMLSSLQYANAAEQDEVTFAVIQDNRMSVLTELWEQPLQYLPTNRDGFREDRPENQLVRYDFLCFGSRGDDGGFRGLRQARAENLPGRS